MLSEYAAYLNIPSFCREVASFQRVLGLLIKLYAIGSLTKPVIQVHHESANRLAYLSARDPHNQHSSMMHHFNEKSIKKCFNQLERPLAMWITASTNLYGSGVRYLAFA